VKSVRERLAQGELSTLDAACHAADVVAAARAGDGLAGAVVAETARWLGIALAAYVTLLNPAAIVIGGGLGLSAFDLLVPPARVEIARRALRPNHESLQIVRAQVMSSAVGAAALVWQKGA
jgi:glucokinase